MNRQKAIAKLTAATAMAALKPLKARLMTRAASSSSGSGNKRRGTVCSR